MSVEQLLREWPPGYGGVERVAHELASVWGGAVYSLDVQRQDINWARSTARGLCPPASPQHKDLWSFAVAAAILGPSGFACVPQIPSMVICHRRGVLLVLVLARLIRPRRRVTAHWHCFLEPGRGCQWPFVRGLSVAGFEACSQAFGSGHHIAGAGPGTGALRLCSHRVFVLPCCLSAEQEQPWFGHGRLCLRLQLYDRCRCSTSAGSTVTSVWIGCWSTFDSAFSMAVGCGW